MDKEGILKKRSGELWNRMFIQTTFRHTGHGEECIINLEGFGQIIDEAKKDLDRRLTELGDVPLEDVIDEYTIWVDHWFGDSS